MFLFKERMIDGFDWGLYVLFWGYNYVGRMLISV